MQAAWAVTMFTQVSGVLLETTFNKLVGIYCTFNCLWSQKVACADRSFSEYGGGKSKKHSGRTVDDDVSGLWPDNTRVDS